MNISFSSFFPLIITFATITLALTSCEVSETTRSEVDVPAAPVLSAEASMRMMEIADGFEVRLVASEPLVTTPVALNFDARGRMWVVEMNGYMPDTTGLGEDARVGKVVILEDEDNDGRMDQRKVFLDSLILPRAICLIGGGMLLAEPPALWYYEIINDKPGRRILVDSTYASGGNVQHQPNGLLRAMDNWIYSAKSSKRYRKAGDKWLVERTHFRGQWGITQDNSGRLFYNTNSDNIMGDYFAPGFGAANIHQQNVAGFSEKIVTDNAVYPSRPTPGVNRGYMKGILDDRLRLINFTAACGPLIYRGGLFGNKDTVDAFVAEPGANLIKRNFLNQDGYRVNGEQAYKGREFLASADERFRPVSLYNGPDGALYVADMYRGILDHITYMTTYLKQQIGSRALKQPYHYGRIYRILPRGKNPKMVVLPENDAKTLVELLGHSNGWVRDKAQQLLVDRKFVGAVPALHEILEDPRSSVFKVAHALWTLEGLGALRMEDLSPLLQHGAWALRMQALSALPSVLDRSNYHQCVPLLTRMVTMNDTLAVPYVAFLAGYIRPYNEVAANNILSEVAIKFPDDRYAADAIVGSLHGREKIFQKKISHFVARRDQAVSKRLKEVIDRAEYERNKPDALSLSKIFPKGAALFASVCQPCHGADGNGLRSIAPPLNKSEWVTGDKRRLIAIVLFGLTGPVRVNDHLYQSPEINGDMPGVGYDPNLSNEDIAELLSYIRRSWQNDADAITSEEVSTLRQKLATRRQAFTVKELERGF